MAAADLPASGYPQPRSHELSESQDEAAAAAAPENTAARCARATLCILRARPRGSSALARSAAAGLPSGRARAWRLLPSGRARAGDVPWRPQ